MNMLPLLSLVQIFMILTMSSASSEGSNGTVSPNVTLLETRLKDMDDKLMELSESRNTGFVGGSWFEHTGGAANKLCLPSDPVLDSGLGTGGSQEIHGAEYQTTFSSKASLEFDVPCAVCRTTSRSSVVMIPGRNICYPGWTMEYHGIIAAGASSHKAATEYLCLDSDAEAVNHSKDNDNGCLFYHVSTKCTSLPCPPYKENWRIPCVVCTI